MMDVGFAPAHAELVMMRSNAESGRPTGRTAPASILLLESQPFVLLGVEAVLSGSDDFHVIGVARSMSAVLPMLATSGASVLVLGCGLPDAACVALVEQILTLRPTIAIVVLGVPDDLALVRRILDSGARAFVDKKSDPECLVHAVRTVNGDGVYVDPVVASKLIRIRTKSERGPLEKSTVLSEREETVLKYVAFGFSAKEISDRIGITMKSVETYKSRATGKLNLCSRAHIVQHAIARGWFADGRAYRF